MKPWGRFSVCGSDTFEEMMTSLLSEIAEKSNKVLTDEVCCALILLGGYGRGEGGVITINGVERPHNNLDFLVIANNLSGNRQSQLQRELQLELAPLTSKYGVEFDIASINESKLRRSRSLVMWYDMRFGHKTIFGNANLVPSLKKFRVDRIPAWDMLNLLVNRGTALIINEHILGKPTLQERDKKLLIRHSNKAIIGYGDALLYSFGKYHWSYVQKQKEVKSLTIISDEFKGLYNQAIQFRFNPYYDDISCLDFYSKMKNIYEILIPVHLLFEKRRLSYLDLSWNLYPKIFAKHVIYEDFFYYKSWAKKLINLVITKENGLDQSLLEIIGLKMAGIRGLLVLSHPVVCYNLDNDDYRELVANLLSSDLIEQHSLRKAYLSKWFNDHFPNPEERMLDWGITDRLKAAG